MAVLTHAQNAAQSRLIALGGFQGLHSDSHRELLACIVFAGGHSVPRS